jgi:hypothetical protein
MDTPEYKKALRLTNTLYCLTDCLESCLIDTNQALKACGMELKFRDKQNFNRCIKAAKELRSAVNGTSEDNQLAFGDSADEIYKLITDYVDNLKTEK